MEIRRSAHGGRKAPAWLCAAINQVAFPGLGSIMAGQRVGYPQALVMVAGFCFTMGYLLIYLSAVIRYVQHSGWSEADFHAAYRPYQWALGVGLPLCGVAWVWAGFTSLSMLKDARTKPSST